MAKKVLFEVMKTGKPAKDTIENSGMTQISNEDELTNIVREVIKNNPKPVEEYKAGKEATLTFLVGQVMKVSKGRANPALVNKLLQQELRN